MKLSERLSACVHFIRPGARVADVGTDHGYLPIYLLKNHIASYCIASDLREKPLRCAVDNARRYRVEDQMDFFQSNGLDHVPVEKVDTVVCAGMGGDLIRDIITRAKELWDPSYQLILQPQSGVPEVREFLWVNGFEILEEKLARDGRFIYSVMNVRYGEGTVKSLGEYFLPPCLKDDPLYPEYSVRVREGIQLTLENLRRAKEPQEEKLAFFSLALSEIDAMEGFE